MNKSYNNSINSKTKRILVISWFFPPINSSEGLVTYKLLKNSFFEYDVFCQNSNSSWSYGEDKAFPKCPNINTIYSDANNLNDWKKEAIDFFYKNHENYDIVMTRSMPPESHEVGLAIKQKFPNIKWIASFGDPIANNPYTFFNNGDLSPYSLKIRYIRHMGILEILSPMRAIKNIVWHFRYKKNFKIFGKKEIKFQDKILKLCDLIIFNNHFQEKYMIKNEKYLKKALVLAHSFDESLYKGNSNKESRKIKMVYIGHLDNIRSPRLFLEAIKSLKSKKKDLNKKLEVNFYGNISKEDKEFIKKSNIEDIVILKESVSYLKSLEIMKTADWLIHIDANISNFVDDNIFFAAKLADYIGADTPMFGITMLSGASYEILNKMNAIITTFSKSDIENYLYLILYENYKINMDAKNKNEFNAITIAKKFDNVVKKLKDE